VFGVGGDGWLNSAGVKGVFTCEIIDYAMGPWMTQELPGRAPYRAARQKHPLEERIHHSDRSGQYCANDYRVCLSNMG
jgi:transposase InsO family protein